MNKVHRVCSFGWFRGLPIAHVFYVPMYVDAQDEIQFIVCSSVAFTFPRNIHPEIGIPSTASPKDWDNTRHRARPSKAT